MVLVNEATEGGDVDIDAALAPALQAIAIALAGIGLCPHDRVVVLRSACLGQLEGVCGGSGAGVVT